MNATYLLHHRMLKSALQETSPDEKHAITVCDFSSDEVVLEGVNANALSKIQYKRIDSAQAEGKKKIPLEKWILGRDLVRLKFSRMGRKYIVFLPDDQSWSPEDRLHHILDLNGRSQGCQLYHLEHCEERMCAVVLDHVSSNLMRAKAYEIYTLGSLPNSEGDEVAAPVGYTHAYLGELSWCFPSEGDQEDRSLLFLDHGRPIKRWRVVSSADLGDLTSKSIWDVQESHLSKMNRMSDDTTLVRPRYSHLDGDSTRIDWNEVSECIVVFHRDHHDGFDRDFRLILDHIEHNHRLFNQNSKYIVQRRTGGECQILFHFRFSDDRSEDETYRLDELLRNSRVFVPVISSREEGAPSGQLYRFIGRAVVPDIFEMAESYSEASDAIFDRLSADQDEHSVRLLMPSKSGYEISYWDLPGLDDWVLLYQAAADKVQSPSFRLPAFEATEKWERNLELEDLVQTSRLQDEPWLQPFENRARSEFDQFEQLVKETTARFIGRSAEAEQKTQEFQAEIKSIEDSLESIQKEIPHLPEGISRLLHEMTSALQAEAAQTKSWHKRVENRESKLNASIASISDATEKLDQAARAVLNRLTTKSEELKNQFSTVNRFVSESKRTSVEISKKVESQEPQIRASMTASEEVLRSVKERRIQVNGEIQELQRKVSGLQTEHLQFKNALVQKSQKRQQLQIEQQELVKTKTALEDEEREVQRLELEITNLRNSIQILREANPKIRQQNDELSAVIKSLSKELSPLKDEKRSLDEQIRRLVRSRASMDDENQSIRDSISSLHEQISASRTELKGLQDEQQEHERVREMTERKWGQLTTKLNDKRKEVELLRSRSKISASPPDVAKYAQKFTFIQEELDHLKDCIETKSSPKRRLFSFFR